MTKANDQTKVRCAIYTRKSTNENLSLEFSSLDYQRESGEAYVVSQKAEGWVCLPDRYDDGGFSGGTMDRPALKRLLSDVEAGRVDCIVIYKIDRLSRSLIDFTKMMEMLEKHDVSLVAVTQLINTTTSTGRLMLNILSSFAQFERELISERTRDKIAAARRKGKWTGGHPLLGYDIERSIRGSRIIVNEDEAQQVRAIFRLYLEHGSLLATSDILNQRGWCTKRWETKAGQSRGGKPCNKARLSHLLTNIIYRGKLRYRDEVHEGEHESIVPADLWQRVQDQLQANRCAGGGEVRNKYNALLKGLLRCSACDAAMGHTYSVKGARRYRYYVCRSAEKKGRRTCPSKSVPALEFEKFVIEQIKGIGKDPALITATIERAEKRRTELMQALKQERKVLRRSVANDRRVLTRATDPTRQAELQGHIARGEHRLRDIDEETESLKSGSVDHAMAVQALARFEPIWNALSPREQRTLLGRLIERIDYDGSAGSVRISFRGDLPSQWFREAANNQMEEVA